MCKFCNYFDIDNSLILGYIIWLFWKYSGKQEKMLELGDGNNRNNLPIIQRYNRSTASLDNHLSGKR